jgi:hypothetical protein
MTWIEASHNGGCRSDSGVVNLYETSGLEKSATPAPLKAVMNLTTSITDLVFNHTRFGDVLSHMRAL